MLIDDNLLIGRGIVLDGLQDIGSLREVDGQRIVGSEGQLVEEDSANGVDTHLLRGCGKKGECCIAGMPQERRAGDRRAMAGGDIGIVGCRIEYFSCTANGYGAMALGGGDVGKQDGLRRQDLCIVMFEETVVVFIVLVGFVQIDVGCLHRAEGVVSCEEGFPFVGFGSKDVGMLLFSIDGLGACMAQEKEFGRPIIVVVGRGTASAIGKLQSIDFSLLEEGFFGRGNGLPLLLQSARCFGGQVPSVVGSVCVVVSREDVGAVVVREGIDAESIVGVTILCGP